MLEHRDQHHSSLLLHYTSLSYTRDISLDMLIYTDMMLVPVSGRASRALDFYAPVSVNPQGSPTGNPGDSDILPWGL